MAIQQITYVNKETFQTSPLPEINKATSANYNEIKDVINNNASEQLPEAPIDGSQYTRKDAGWEILSTNGLTEVPLELASSTDDPTSGHAALQGVVVVNGTIAITDQNTLSLLWYIDYGSGYVLANATGTLAGLKTDLEANLLLASDKANVRYVAIEQVAYIGDMVNGFFVTMIS